MVFSFAPLGGLMQFLRQTPHPQLWLRYGCN
jgi:hypothetical protein